MNITFEIQWVLIFKNLSVWNFNILWSPNFILLFQPFMTGSDTLDWDHVAGESACFTALLLCRSFLAQLSGLPVSVVTCLHPWWHETLLQPCNVFYASKKQLHFNEDKFSCVFLNFLRLYYYWCSISPEPKRHFTLKINSAIRDSFISPIKSHPLRLCWTNLVS